MEKINLNLERGFSDSITVTFNFIKQEFKPLLRSFAFIVLPFIFADMFVKSYVVRQSLSMMIEPSPGLEASLANLGTTMWSYLSTMIVYFWVGLFAISYIRVYLDKFNDPEESLITPGEVWQVMVRNMGKMVLWGFLYMLIVCVGTLLFIVPGLYFAVAFGCVAYFMVIRGDSISSGMSASQQLIRGQWWNFFGYIFVLQLIVGGLSYVFSIPYVVLTFKSMFSQEMPGPYETTFGIMFSTLGQNMLQIISVVGIAIRFFSFREQKEHATLLGKIEEMGNE